MPEGRPQNIRKLFQGTGRARLNIPVCLNNRPTVRAAGYNNRKEKEVKENGFGRDVFLAVFQNVERKAGFVITLHPAFCDIEETLGLDGH
jgi:hypothetical protein